jgi:glyoxylase-like metal-dependent hydrolase (beta-lactamase superfamily II)
MGQAFRALNLRKIERIRMRRTAALRIVTTMFGIVGIFAAYTQNPAPRPLRTQKVKDNLYMISGDGGNVAVLVTNEGVALVDDMYERNYADIMVQVKSITKQPVKYVFNTHQHDDHAGSNAKMMISAEVISHRNVRANMVRLKQPGQPRVVFSTEMSVFLGGHEIRGQYFGRGHTNGDAVIYFPDLKIIHTGDLFLTNSTPALPFMDFAQGGSAIEWTDTIDRMMTLDFDTVIPGHGPVSNRDGVVKWRADLASMRGRIRDMVHQGKSKDEISDVLTGTYKWPKGGLAIAQVDAFIEEMKSWQ